jgi:hypothetical protein
MRVVSDTVARSVFGATYHLDMNSMNYRFDPKLTAWVYVGDPVKDIGANDVPNSYSGMDSYSSGGYSDGGGYYGGGGGGYSSTGRYSPASNVISLRLSTG